LEPGATRRDKRLGENKIKLHPRRAIIYLLMILFKIEFRPLLAGNTAAAEMVIQTATGDIQRFNLIGAHGFGDIVQRAGK